MKCICIYVKVLDRMYIVHLKLYMYIVQLHVYQPATLYMLYVMDKANFHRFHTTHSYPARHRFNYCTNCTYHAFTKCLNNEIVECMIFFQSYFAKHLFSN